MSGISVQNLPIKEMRGISCRRDYKSAFKPELFVSPADRAGSYGGADLYAIHLWMFQFHSFLFWERSQADRSSETSSVCMPFSCSTSCNATYALQLLWFLLSVAEMCLKIESCLTLVKNASACHLQRAFCCLPQSSALFDFLPSL